LIFLFPFRISVYSIAFLVKHWSDIPLVHLEVVSYGFKSVVVDTPSISGSRISVYSTVGADEAAIKLLLPNLIKLAPGTSEVTRKPLPRSFSVFELDESVLAADPLGWNANETSADTFSNHSQRSSVIILLILVLFILFGK